MKISIITVAYNSAQTIADTLLSVEQQSHADIEYIVIDGASTDATAQIVNDQGRRVSVFISEPDRGIYDAMNKGIALATGEMIGFLNADDIYANSEVVGKIVAAASSPAVHMVFGDLVYVAADNTNRVVRLWRSGEFVQRGLKYGWMPPHPTFYIRRSLIESLGGFDRNLRVAADYDFMLRYLVRPGATAAYVPEVLVKMRLGGASNRSLAAMRLKSREDLLVLQRYRVGGLMTLLCKNMRKIPQFFRH